MEGRIQRSSIAPVNLTPKIKFLKSQGACLVTQCSGLPQRPDDCQGTDNYLDERYREGLIPPGALRCKEQGQRVCELPRDRRVRHGREPVRGVREVSGAITSVVFVPCAHETKVNEAGTLFLETHC